MVAGANLNFYWLTSQLSIQAYYGGVRVDTYQLVDSWLKTLDQSSG